MDAIFGIGLGVFGTSITIIGFFIAFLVVNYNRKREKQKLEEEKSRSKVHNYWGDDTV